MNNEKNRADFPSYQGNPDEAKLGGSGSIPQGRETAQGSDVEEGFGGSHSGRVGIGNPNQHEHHYASQSNEELSFPAETGEVDEEEPEGDLGQFNVKDLDDESDQDEDDRRRVIRDAS